MNLLKLVVPVLMLFVFANTAKAQTGQTGGYATVRVFDCNKSVALGTGYVSARIYIVYEDGRTEEVPLQSYSEKNELDNLKTVNQIINKLKSKGYFLIAQYTTGEQGNLISDYTFLKQQ